MLDLIQKNNFMLKKIPINDLRIGMYIEKLDGNWLKHPSGRPHLS